MGKTFRPSGHGLCLGPTIVLGVVLFQGNNWESVIVQVSYIIGEGHPN